MLLMSVVFKICAFILYYNETNKENMRDMNFNVNILIFAGFSACRNKKK